MVVGAVVVVAALVVGVVVLVGRQHGGGSATTSAAGSATAAGPGEPQLGLLGQQVVAGGSRYGATGVFDACAVLPLAAVRDSGIPALPYADRHRQRHLTRDVPEGRPQPGGGEPVSSCEYQVPGVHGHDANPTGWVSVDVFQQPYDTDLSTDLSYQRRIPGETRATVSGLTVASGVRDGALVAEVGPPTGLRAEVRGQDLADDYGGVAAAEVFRKVTSVVAGNLAKGAVEHATFRYGGGYQDVPDGCAVLTAEVFARAAGTADTGVVQQDFSDGEQRVNTEDGVATYSVTQRCQRDAPASANGVHGRGLAVQLTTYRDLGMAERVLRFDCDADSPGTQVHGRPAPAPERVGAGPACAIVVGSPVFAFRVGRTEVRLEPDQTWSGPDLGAFARSFTGTAQAVAANLVG